MSPPPILATNDDALAWVTRMVEDCEAARLACDVPLVASAPTTVVELRRRERVYLLKHGAALGALGALLRCARISDVAYNTFVQRVRATLVGEGLHD